MIRVALPVAVAAALSAPLAQADDTESRTLLLPQVKVSASTSGSAEFMAGPTLLFAVPGNADVEVIPYAKTKTKEGNARVLQIGGEADQPDVALPWRLGLSASYMTARKTQLVTSKDQLKELKQSYHLCASGCTDEWKAIDETDADQKKFCTAAKGYYDEMVEDVACAESEVQAEIAKKRSRFLHAARAEAFQVCAQECVALPPSDDETSSPEQQVCKRLQRVAQWPAPHNLIDPANLCATGTALYETRSAELLKWLEETTKKSCDEAKKEKLRSAAVKAGAADTYISVDELCTAGLKQYNKRIAPHVIGVPLPPTTLGVGFAAGRDKFNYRATTDAGSLAKESATEWALQAGLLGFHILDPQITIEWAAVFELASTPSSEQIQWCTPSGHIERAGQEYDDLDDSTYDIAESCSSSVLGAPSSSRSIEPHFEIGWINQTGETWRAAFGAHVKLEFPENDRFQVATFGLQIPIYFDLVKAPESVGDYRGLLRLVPILERALNRESGRETIFSVNVEVLGQRTLVRRIADVL